MSDADILELSEEERDGHLGNGGTGVLSLSTTGTEPPQTIPVSYGYHAGKETFYFRLSTEGASAPEDFDGCVVSFVTYGDDEEGWWSVIAKGRLEDVERTDIATETLDGLDRVHIPLVDMFDAPIREVPFEFLRLIPEEFTARAESNRNL